MYTVPLNGFKRRDWIERLAKINDRRTQRDAQDTSANHAADMIQWKRLAKPFARFDAQKQTTEVTVVQQPVMSQRRRLGRSGCAGCELDIDWIVGLQKFGKFDETSSLRRATHGLNFGKPIIPGLVGVGEMDRGRQMRQPC